MAADIDIELNGVSKVFGDVTAVDRVDAVIRRGEFFALLGPSGCGKTTLLRMLAGFDRPSSGEILIRGQSMNLVPPNRRPTNLVFQHLALFPHLDVDANVAFGLKMSRVPVPEIARRVQDALDLVQLGGYGKRAISQLSGGQKQRVAIARALVNAPLVLLLDEPLSSLDHKLRQQMQLELKALQGRLGTTFVYVTHDQSEAMTLSDRVAVMNGGRIEQVGPPQEVYLRPRTRFVATFIGDSNVFDAPEVVRDGASTAVNVAGLGRCVVPDGSAGAHLVIRPEFIKVGQPALACPNRFNATLTQKIFQGSSTRAELRLPSGAALVAELRGSDSGFGEVGEIVPVGWSPADSVLVAAS